MRSTVSAFLLLPLFVVVGCVPDQMLVKDVPKQVDRWVAEEEYGKALKLIERVDPDDPQYASLREQRKEILRLADKYEQAVLREGRRLTQNGQWQQADELYTAGMEKLPDSERIAKARAAFVARRAEHVRSLRTEVLINKGNWLARELPLQNQILTALPDDAQAKKSLKRAKREVETTSAGLYLCGQRALDSRNNKLAVQCLALAEQLTPNTSVKDALARAEKEQQKKKAKTRRARRKKQEQFEADKARRLFDAYQDAYKADDLLTARNALAELKTVEPKSDKVEQLGLELEDAIGERLKRGMEESRRLYSQGKIQQALDNWRDLSKLDPENEDLKAHIARAERVLAKLRELSEKQPASQVLPVE
ncbi:MAG: hypothetical protein QNK18_09980 [Gammaproteobacteria bacterium]|nr:hypothetical protein [Gammaproteobacteria bacterium]